MIFADIFCRNQLPTRQYQVIEFAPSNKLIMEINLPSTNLDQFLRRIKFPFTLRL